MKRISIIFSIFILLLGLGFLSRPAKSEAYFGVSLNFGSNNGYGYGNSYGGYDPNNWRAYSNGYSYGNNGYFSNYQSYGNNYGYGNNMDGYFYSNQPMYGNGYNSYSRYNYNGGYRNSCMSSRCY